MPEPTSPTAWNPDAAERLAHDVGARLAPDAYGPTLAVGAETLPDGAFAAPLADLGLLTVTGADATTFLHAQLTNDVAHLQAGSARWGGYCSAKGRLISTFRYWRDDTAILLALARPMAQPVARRLSMFVLRAKAKVADASDDCVTFGLAGDAAASAAAAAFGLRVPGADESASAAGAHLIGLPALHEWPQPAGFAGGAAPVRTAEPSAAPALPTALLAGIPDVATLDVAAGGSTPAARPSRARWLLVVPATEAARAWDALIAAAAPVGGAAWRRTEVMAAIPRIVPGTSELFVPQMLNFESVDGVDFRKGCYPGQEVVARSQYLGKLKRRMFVAHGTGSPPEPGSDVMSAAGAEPCGQVVLAAPDGRGGFDLLFESQVAAVEAGPVHAGTVPLTVHALPYPLKAID